MLVISLFSIMATLAVAPPSVTTSDVAGKLKALAPNQSKDERLAAAKWFVKNALSQETLKALASLEQVARKDKSPEVRCQAVLAAGRIAAAHKKPCPKAVNDALLDEEESLDGLSPSWFASSVIQQLKAVPLSARPILIKRFLATARREKSADGRDAFLELEAFAARDPAFKKLVLDDKDVMRVIRSAVKAKDLVTQWVGHRTLSVLTNELGDILIFSVW